MKPTRSGVVRAVLATATAAVLVPLGLSTAQAVPLPSGYGQPVADAAATAMTESTGLSNAEAMQRLAAQPGLLSTGESLVDQLGTQAAGMWLDQANGTVVVNVLSEQAAQTVRSAGATAQVVQRSMAELQSIHDAVAAKLPVDTAAGIDVRANQVVVQIGKAAAADRVSTLTATAQQYGSAVRTEHIAGSFDILISGGDAILGGGGRCSLGFNTTSNTGITAGHCAGAIGSWTDASGAYYGPSIAASFPGNDFGLIRNDGGLPQPGNVNLYNGGYQDITGSADPYVGMSVCKSGSTTGLTCGSVHETNVTICYAEGCVDNMARSDAYAAPGDSGGAWFSGSTAVGLTSGGGGGWTYFQPVNEGLNAYGVGVF